MDEFYYTDILQDSIPGELPPFLRMLVTPLKRYQTDSVPQNHIALNRDGSFTDQCARYANERLRALGYNVWGNAWTRNSGNKVLSGYDYIKEKRPGTFSRQALNKYNKMAADAFKDRYNPYLILDNDIVSLYYDNSDALKQAYLEGFNGVTNTHTGNVRIINNIPYVEHNIHGVVYTEKLEDLLGSNGKVGIVGIWRPGERSVKFNSYPKFQSFNK